METSIKKKNAKDSIYRHVNLVINLVRIILVLFSVAWLTLHNNDNLVIAVSIKWWPHNLQVRICCKWLIVYANQMTHLNF